MAISSATSAPAYVPPPVNTQNTQAAKDTDGDKDANKTKEVQKPAEAPKPPAPKAPGDSIVNTTA